MLDTLTFLTRGEGSPVLFVLRTAELIGAKLPENAIGNDIVVSVE